MATTTQTRTRKGGASPPAPFEAFFTSGGLKGMVLLLIMAFNVAVLKNSYQLAVPETRLLGEAQADAWLYGLAIAVLMVVVLFHENHWENAWCPGAITLYLNLGILMLYLKWLDKFLGGLWSLWLLSGLLMVLPVVGLFVMVTLLKRPA